MFENRTTLLITLSINLKFITIEYIPSWTIYQISKSLNKVIKVYGRGGFVIRVIMKDTEFKKVIDKLGKV